MLLGWFYPLFSTWILQFARKMIKEQFYTHHSVVAAFSVLTCDHILVQCSTEPRVSHKIYFPADGNNTEFHYMQRMIITIKSMQRYPYRYIYTVHIKVLTTTIKPSPAL